MAVLMLFVCRLEKEGILCASVKNLLLTVFDLHIFNAQNSILFTILALLLFLK